MASNASAATVSTGQEDGAAGRPASELLALTPPDAERPLVSVIIPVHNCQEWLSECFESVVAQTYTNLGELDPDAVLGLRSRCASLPSPSSSAQLSVSPVAPRGEHLRRCVDG